MAKCPHCRFHYLTLDDEADMHDCPRCGYGKHRCPWCGEDESDCECPQSADYEGEKER